MRQMAGSRAGPAQVMVDLLAHHIGLAGDERRQRAGLLRGLGQHHRQRGLQGVGEVADMGPGTLDHFPVVHDQRVDLAYQGRELPRIFAIEIVAPPGPHLTVVAEPSDSIGERRDIKAGKRGWHMEHVPSLPGEGQEAGAGVGRGPGVSRAAKT